MSFVGYINFDPITNSTPEIFNPNTFNSNIIISNNVQTNDLTVSGSALITGAVVANSSSVATTQYVDNKVSSLIGSAPDFLNTLQEIEEAINSDPNFSQTITNQLSLKAPIENPVFTGDVQIPTLYLDNVNLNTRLTTDETNITTNTSNIATNTSNIATNTSNIATNTTNIATNTTNIATNTTNISTNTNNITTLQSSKADKANTLYSNTYYVNAGVNKLSDVLSSIGNLTSKCIVLSASGISETDNTTEVVINKTNLTIFGPDCAFNSPSTIVNFPITLNSSASRVRLSNIGFAENFIIDGSTGKHVFKACTFDKNFSLINTTTNWIIFNYCSFSGQVNIPITFGGYIIFYFCDFAGATLNFNNSSNQQVLMNSCINLPSFSLNALLNGFNYTTTSSAINTVSLNCSGSVVLPSNAISISNVNELSSRLTTDETNITTNTNSITSINNAITDIQTKNTSQDNSITSINSTLATKADDSSVVHKTNVNETIQGIKTFSTPPLIGTYNIATTNDISTAISNLVNGSPSTLDTLNELAVALGNDPNFATTISTQIGSKAEDSSVIHLSGSETITGQKTFENNIIVGSAYDINLKGTNLTTTLNGKQNTLSYDSTPISSSSNFLTSGSIYTTLLNYVTSSSLTSTLASYVTSSSLTSTLASYVTSSSLTSTLSSYVLTSALSAYVTSSSLTSTLSSYVTSSSLTSRLASYVTSSSLTSTLASYLTTSTASSTYQTQSGMSSYLTTSTAQTVSATKTFSRLAENITSGSITTNVLTIDFSSNNSVIYVTPSANYTINITNLPSGTQTNSYTFTIWNTAKFYATAVQVRGSAQTLLAVGGASNLSTNVNSSATNLMQQVTLVYVNSTTPTKVLTSVASIF